MKYIVIGGVPVLFGSELIHSEILKDKREMVEAAGFVLLDLKSSGFKVICNGESDSLSIACRGETDVILIRKLLLKAS
jgi:hypothetical protein